MGTIPQRDDGLTSRRRWRRRLRHIGLGLACAIALTPVAPSRAGNEFSYGYVNGQDPFGITAYRGHQNVRTNPPLVAGLVYLHPMQAVFGGAGTFIAIGTYKGHAIPPECPRHTGNWMVYTDGTRPNGQYFCQAQGITFSTGGDPELKLSRTTCPGGIGWGAYVNGTRVDCRSAYHGFANTLGAGLEIASGPHPISGHYNLDVRLTHQQEYSSVYGVWLDVGFNRRRVHPGYNLDFVNPRQTKAYLPPWD